MAIIIHINTKWKQNYMSSVGDSESSYSYPSPITHVTSIQEGVGTAGSAWGERRGTVCCSFDLPSIQSTDLLKVFSGQSSQCWAGGGAANKTRNSFVTSWGSRMDSFRQETLCDASPVSQSRRPLQPPSLSLMASL